MKTVDEIVSPEYREEAIRRIDARLRDKAHNEAMRAEAARRRKVEIYDDPNHVNPKYRTLFISQPVPTSPRAYAQRQNTTDDDHDANYSVNEQPKPGGHSRAFCLLNTPETVKAVRAGEIRYDPRNL